MQIDTLKFYLNGQLNEISNFNINTTILDYLRSEANLKGTKEGCAEGDCGACTIAIVSLINNELKFEAVNSCIQLLATLHGKYVFTVEGIADKNNEHPCQKAMVQNHGSQCGFCTPGFVMSMFAYYHNHQNETSIEKAHEVLAGNLCRCTGYRPIIDAFLDAMQQRDYQLVHDDETIIQLLKSLKDDSGFHYQNGTMKYFAPRTLDEFVQLKQKHPQAKIWAGGTDLGLFITKRFQNFNTIIYTGCVDALFEIKEQHQAIEIGGAVTYTGLFEKIKNHFPSLSDLFFRIGSTQIRNSGTIAGNIVNASPIGDTLPALMSLNASVKLISIEGEREMPLDEFVVGYQKTALQDNEILQSISINFLKEDQKYKVYKISKRALQDISAFCGAFNFKIDAQERIVSSRIFFGGMAATPKRALSLEKFIQDQPKKILLSDQIFQIVKSEFTPLSDMRASAAYRLQVAANLCQKFYYEVFEKKDLTL